MAQTNPFDQFDAEPSRPQQPMGRGASRAPTAARAAKPPANDSDPFAEFDGEAPTVDTSNIMGFSDELPETASHQLSPEDEAELLAMFKRGASASEAREFVASKGYGGFGDNFDEVVKARDAGVGVNNEVSYDLPRPIQQDGATGAGLRGFGDTAALGWLDEAGGVVDALGGTVGRESVWNSDIDFTDLVRRNTDINRGILSADERDHPIARVTGQLIGGLAIPAGMEGVAFKAGRDALRAGLSMQEARAVAAQAVTSRLIKQGAAQGAAYGAGSSEGGFGNAALGAAGGAALGAGGGLALGKAGEAIAPRLTARAAAARAAPASDTEQFAKAAERQDLDYLAADLPGATKSRFATGFTGITLGGIPLAEAAQKTIAKAKAARDRIASGIGMVSDKEDAGKAAQRGAKQWMGESERKGDALYQAIPIPPKSEATANNTRAALLEITKEMESNPELSALWVGHPRLKATLEALTPKEGTKTVGPAGYPKFQKQVGTGEFEGGKISWEDMKRLRSIVGEIAGRPSLGADGDQVAAMRKFYGALSEDMRATAAASSPEALKAFNRANTYWRGRSQRIDNILTDILGADLGKGGQPAFEAINRLARKDGGDPAKLAVMLRTMPPDEADAVRGTILSRLGRSSSGRQDDAGEMFSPAEMVTQWDQLSPKAKSILFQGEHRRAIDDVMKVAAGMKAGQQFANTSKTSIGTNITALGGIGLANLPAAIAMAAAQFGGGKLLGSPRFARWVASGAKKPNPAAQLAHINQLAAVAKAEPAIANDVLNLQQKLAEAFIKSPSTRAAAEQDQNVGSEPPEQEGQE